MSKAITQEQLSYLADRLDQITDEKMHQKRIELYGPEGRPQSPTWKMVFEAIKAGEIVLKPENEDCTRAYLMPTDVVWPAMEQKAKDLDAYEELLMRERQAILDEYMLGGVDGATEALKRFSGL